MATLYPRNYLDDRDDDEISLISMQELAPTPVDNDDPAPPDPSDSQTQLHLSHADTAFSSFSPSFSASSFSSSGSIPPQRRLTYWLLRTQEYSAYVFSAFLCVHGATAALTPLLLGVDAGNSSLLLARTYFYQAHPAVEAVVVPGAVAAHVGAGLALRILRRSQQKTRYGGRPPASVSLWRWRNFSASSRTGWVLVPFVAAHAGLLRAVPLLTDGDSSEIGLEFLAHGFYHARWARAVGGVAYGVFVGLVSYHVVYGAAKYWGVAAGRRARRLRGAAAGMAGVWLGGLAVVVRSGPVRGYLGRHYDHLYRVFFGRV